MLSTGASVRIEAVMARMCTPRIPDQALGPGWREPWDMALSNQPIRRLIAGSFRLGRLVIPARRERYRPC